MKILIADDDPLTLDALGECIRAEGYSVFAAGNGEEALELWRRENPQLVCLDIMMPVMDGYEVCRRIRAKDSAVPILFLSAKNEEIDVVVGLELGADDFIRKPFTRNEVMARIRAAMRRAKVSRPGSAVLQFQELTVWPEELRAQRDGRQIELTPREAAILSLLHQNAGRPVSRNQLLDQCWGLDYFPDSRTLDQHIASLRKKIELDPGMPRIIETVRGIGYRFRSSPAVNVSS